MGLLALDLCSGIGGAALAGELNGFTTVCYVEADQARIDVLKRRIADGVLDDAPIWDDLRTFDGRPWAGAVDVVVAGFPCQPFSVAGARRGASDTRNLWPDVIRTIRDVGPDYVFLENVPGLRGAGRSEEEERSGYLGQVLRDLAESGFHVRWDVLPAALAGATHERERLWVVAVADGCRQRLEGLATQHREEHRMALQRWSDPRGPLPDGHVGNPGSEGFQGRSSQQVEAGARSGNGCCSVGDSGSERLSDAELLGVSAEARREQSVDGWAAASEPSRTPLWPPGPEDIDAWRRVHPSLVPGLCRVAHGVPDRVERIKGLGNAQVPVVAALAWRALQLPLLES